MTTGLWIFPPDEKNMSAQVVSLSGAQHAETTEATLQNNYDIRVQRCADLQDKLDERENKVRELQNLLYIADQRALQHEDQIARLSSALQHSQTSLEQAFTKEAQTQEKFEALLRLRQSVPPSALEEAALEKDKHMSYLIEDVRSQQQHIEILRTDMKKLVNFIMQTNIEAIEPFVGMTQEHVLPKSVEAYWKLSDYSSGIVRQIRMRYDKYLMGWRGPVVKDTEETSSVKSQKSRFRSVVNFLFKPVRSSDIDIDSLDDLQSDRGNSSSWRPPTLADLLHDTESVLSDSLGTGIIARPRTPVYSSMRTRAFHIEAAVVDRQIVCETKCAEWDAERGEPFRLGWSSFHLACAHGDVESIQRILSGNAAQSYEACENGSLETGENEGQENAESCIADSLNCIETIELGHETDGIEESISDHANAAGVDALTHSGFSGIFIAAFYNHADACEALLAAGASVNQYDARQNSCLHAACTRLPNACIPYLLDAHADSGTRNCSSQKAPLPYRGASDSSPSTPCVVRHTRARIRKHESPLLGGVWNYVAKTLHAGRVSFSKREEEKLEMQLTIEEVDDGVLLTCYVTNHTYNGLAHAILQTVDDAKTRQVLVCTSQRLLLLHEATIDVVFQAALSKLDQIVISTRSAGLFILCNRERPDVVLDVPSDKRNALIKELRNVCSEVCGSLPSVRMAEQCVPLYDRPVVEPAALLAFLQDESFLILRYSEDSVLVGKHSYFSGFLDRYNDAATQCWDPLFFTLVSNLVGGALVWSVHPLELTIGQLDLSSISSVLPVDTPDAHLCIVADYCDDCGEMKALILRAETLEIRENWLAAIQGPTAYMQASLRPSHLS